MEVFHSRQHSTTIPPPCQQRPPPAMSTSPLPEDTNFLLPLPDNRQLAYAHSGPVESPTVVLFFPGIFSIAKAPDPTDAHSITVTLPGWGQSSPHAAGVAYHTSLITDVAILLSTVHPSPIESLYIAGGSFGTAAAQMVYGAGFDIFPLGTKVKGLMLLSGFSPFRQHKEYTACLNWANYVAVGPPSRLPFHAAQKAFKVAMGSKLGDVKGACGFIRETLFDKMDAEERAIMEPWLAKKGMSEEELVTEMGEGCALSVAHTWEGFMEVSDVLHSDWGFVPSRLDDAHNRVVLIVGAERDDIGGGMNTWLGDNYKNAVVDTVKGGHIGTLFALDELWAKLFKLAGESRST